MYRVLRKRAKSTYVYEQISSWDTKKQRPKTKSRYLGKLDPVTGCLLPKDSVKRSQTPQNPSSSVSMGVDFGSTYFLEQLFMRSPLRQVLEKHFPDNYEAIQCLLIFLMDSKQALSHYPHWHESVALERPCPMDGPGISRLLTKLGAEDLKRSEFLKSWRKLMRHHCADILFDITSFSSHSSSIEDIEFGYNRDKEKLPQINFGLVLGLKKDVPLFYTTYPGSITDVSTLKNLLHQMNEQGITGQCWFLDRGFYSKKNILQLASVVKEFVIPWPFTVQESKAIASRCKESSQLTKHSYVSKNKVLYIYREEQVKIADKTFFSYAFYDRGGENTFQTHLFSNIQDLELNYRDKVFSSFSDAEDAIRKYGEKFLPVFDIREKKGKQSSFTISQNEHKLKDLWKYAGVFVFLSASPWNPGELLERYRTRDAIEKQFDALKNELRQDRLRTHNQFTTDGKLFLRFLLLCFHGEVIECLKTMPNFDSSRSLENTLNLLRRLKRMNFAADIKLLEEVSKRQKAIFRHAKIVLDSYM